MQEHKLLFCCFVWLPVYVVCSSPFENISLAVSEDHYAVGYIPDCPGSERDIKISSNILSSLMFEVFLKNTKGIYRRRYPLHRAAEGISSDPHVDFENKATVVYISGLYDSTSFPYAGTLGEVYSVRDFNVILVDTNRLTTYYYPLAARIAQVVGKHVGRVLVRLADFGLRPSSIEMVGLSLGAHTCSFAAKYYRRVTGNAIQSLVGLDPAGPCFKNRPAHLRYDGTDAEFVQTVRTNVDGFGMPNYSGGLDFYVNGGEYQMPVSLELPCLTFCSHVRSIVLWLIAVENPSSFIGLRCESVIQARLGRCQDRVPRVTNTMGPNANRSSLGVYYLQTTSEYPYYMGLDGINNSNFIKNYLRDLNVVEELNY